MAYSFTDKQVLAVWTVPGNQIQARTFDGGATFYAAQKLTGGIFDKFVIRGRNILTRTDVTMQSGIPQSVYLDLAGGDTGISGLEPPVFQTPAGYTKKALSDGTIYYEANGTTGCVLTNGLQIGTFIPDGSPLQAMQFNGKWYIVQVTSTSPLKFVPRGKNILANANYTTVSLPACVDAFDSENSDANGAAIPASFPATIAGYTQKVFADGTKYFEKDSTSGGTVQPVITVQGGISQNNDGAFVITPGQSVTINSVGGGSSMQWRGIAGSVDFPYGVSTASITLQPPSGYTLYLVSLDSAGNTLAVSNKVTFVTSTGTLDVSAGPTTASANVAIGQPIVLAACASGIIEFKIGSGTWNIVDQIVDSAGRFEFLPSRDYKTAGTPTVGQVITFRVTCPGKQASTSTVAVTLIAVPASNCDAIVDGTALGVWTAQSAILKARKFGDGLWVTQVTTVAGGRESFVVRSRNILTRTDVTTSYGTCGGSFLGGDNGAGGAVGLVIPPTFPGTLAGYTPKTYADGTPYWESNSGAASVPVPQITSSLTALVGSNIQGVSGDKGTIKVFLNGTFLTDVTGVTGNFTYVPTQAGAYSFKLQNSLGGLSTLSGTVTVSLASSGGGTCSINDKQEVGTAIGGDKLIARVFGGKTWLTQLTLISPETFVVRGPNYIENSGVTSSYKTCKSSFSGGDTAFGGNSIPASFATPDGFTMSLYSDGTPKFTSSTGSTGGTGGTGTDQSANPGTGVATAIYRASVNNTCGNPIDYAVSKTIPDPKDSRLVWQTSTDFTLAAGTYFLHARQSGTSGSTQIDVTQQVLVTV